MNLHFIDREGDHSESSLTASEYAYQLIKCESAWINDIGYEIHYNPLEEWTIENSLGLCIQTLDIVELATELKRLMIEEGKLNGVTLSQMAEDLWKWHDQMDRVELESAMTMIGYVNSLTDYEVTPSLDSMREMALTWRTFRDLYKEEKSDEKANN